MAVLIALSGGLMISCGKKNAPRRDPGINRTDSAAGKEPRIRVLLVMGAEGLEIKGSTRGEKVKVNAIPGGLRLSKLEGGAAKTLEEGTGFRLTPAGELLEVNGRKYRGLIDVFVNPLKKTVAVNDLAMEEYLRSVVPNELGPKKYAELEALKAQAVAARTFALAELGKNAERGFDVFPDSRSQIYSGIAVEHPLSDKAVRESAGQFAFFRGKPINALYCSTCGGVTEAFQLIFKGGPIEYLKGGVKCKDSSSPYHKWDEWVEIASRSAQLERFASVGRLKDVVPLEHSKAGRVVAMKFIGEKGEKILKGNDLRFALGLRSNWVVDFEKVRDKSGFLTRIRVRGRGWGHGVGMCQIGAFEMAQKGKSSDEILAHYYPGIDLKRLY